MSEGSIYQRRSDGRWLASIQVYGVRRTVYATSEREAKQKLAELRRQLIGNGFLANPGKRTVSDLIDDWLTTVAPSLKPKSLLGYKQTLAHVRPEVGSIRLSKLEPSHLQRLYNSLGAKSARNAYKAHLLLHAALQMAVVWGWLPSSPADRVIRPKYGCERREIWTLEQLRDFLDGTSEHWLHSLFVVAVSSGCRLAELNGLRWEDVDLTTGTLKVRHNLQFVERQWVEGTPKTRAGKRAVSLPLEAVDALRRQRSLQAEFRLRAGSARVENDLVFTGQRGQPLQQTTVENALRYLCERLELPPLTPHGLRHLHASLLLEAGLPVPEVSARLGHARPSVTLSIYAHRVSNGDQRAAEAMDAALGHGLSNAPGTEYCPDQHHVISSTADASPFHPKGQHGCATEFAIDAQRSLQ